MSEKRNKIRERVFKKHAIRTETVTLFGADIELRQPSVGKVLDIRDEPDQKKALVRVLIDYCFVPGTEEPIFEEADLDLIMSWPVGEWFTDLNEAFTKITNIDLGRLEKNLGPTSTGKPSTPSPSGLASSPGK